MLLVEIDEASGIAVLEPSGPLSKDDFELAAKIIDPYIEKSGKLNGLIIHAESFPGWDSFAALSSHLSFVREHHKIISRVALSTDSAFNRSVTVTCSSSPVPFLAIIPRSVNSKSPFKHIKIFGDLNFS